MGQGKLEPKMIAKTIQKGEVRNPNGRPKGFKTAKTIVKEFMDGKTESLKGTKVSRFQYLLYSMFEINHRLQKQLDFREAKFKKAIEREETYLAEHQGEAAKDYKRDELARNTRGRAKEYEELLQQVQNSQGKLAEFFLKTSGQYADKTEIENKLSQPMLVAVSRSDLRAAKEDILSEINQMDEDYSDPDAIEAEYESEEVEDYESDIE